ncbi:unnamed protein product [Caenorhabditis brenneri]
MASSSHFDTSVANSADSDKDEIDIASKELDESLEKCKFGLAEMEKKTEQINQVRASISSLKLTLEEKEQQLEKKKKKLVGRNRSLMIEIENEVDDIKVLKEVMNMKKLEREQRKMEQKALHKAFKASWRHSWDLTERIVKMNDELEEKRDREGEGEAVSNQSKVSRGK